MKSLADINFGPLTGFGTLGNPGGNGVGIFTTFLTSAVGLLTVVAIIWFVFTFIIGAIGIISSGGDKAALESARKKIVSGIIGLVVTIAAIFVVRLFGLLLGIPNILNIGALLGL